MVLGTPTPKKVAMPNRMPNRKNGYRVTTRMFRQKEECGKLMNQRFLTRQLLNGNGHWEQVYHQVTSPVVDCSGQVLESSGTQPGLNESKCGSSPK